jgi:methionyl aminopeptidase
MASTLVDGVDKLAVGDSKPSAATAKANGNA